LHNVFLLYFEQHSSKKPVNNSPSYMKKKKKTKERILWPKGKINYKQAQFKINLIIKTNNKEQTRSRSYGPNINQNHQLNNSFGPNNLDNILIIATC
jgi:hypothetical protein